MTKREWWVIGVSCVSGAIALVSIVSWLARSSAGLTVALVVVAILFYLVGLAIYLSGGKAS
jgi:hypothetical protein